MSTKVSFLLLIFLASCSGAVDSVKEKKFAGTYWMSIDPVSNEKELSSAKDEMKKDMEQAREEIRKSMEEAKKELSVKQDSLNVKVEGLEKMLDGIGKLAEGVTDMAETMGDMSINLPKNILKGIKIKFDFRDDGTVKYAGDKHINIDTNLVKWEIRDGKLVLIDDDGSEEVFEMKQVNGSDWELRKEGVMLHLTKDK